MKFVFSPDVILVVDWAQSTNLVSQHYLSTLDPEHVSTVGSSAARPAVEEIVTDQRYGKYSFYATIDCTVFEYDLNRYYVIDWIPAVKRR